MVLSTPPYSPALFTIIDKFSNLIPMPNKSPTKYYQDILDSRIFKWEFLRRNKDYINDFNNLFKLKGDIKTDAAIKKIEKKFSLKFLLPPDYSFLNAAKPRTKSQVKAAIKELQILHSLFADQSPLKCLSVFFTKEKAIGLDESLIKTKAREPNTILVSINLDTSKEELTTTFSNLLDIWQATVSKHINKPLRPRLTAYKDYLKVYDYKINDGLTFVQIAKKLYPNKDQAETLVRKHFNAAKRLIDGEYSRIR